VVAGDNYDLFWSLSFAVTPATWRRIGGFCELYRGYGGEDTDFAHSAAGAGVGLRWVGGAHAFHQHHPVSNPPVQHLDDILRNAQVFHRRWGWWPMSGWLDAFAAQGLITWAPDGTPVRLSAPA
jgi:GT2 family glycosyltransferase